MPKPRDNENSPIQYDIPMELFQPGLWKSPFGQGYSISWESIRKTLFGWSTNDIFNRRTEYPINTRIRPIIESDISSEQRLERYEPFIESALNQSVCKIIIESLASAIVGALNPIAGGVMLSHAALVFIREQYSLSQAKKIAGGENN